MRRFTALALAALLLTGCGAAPTPDQSDGSTPPAQSQGAASQEGQGPNLPSLENAQALEELTAAHFGAFSAQWPTQYDSYQLSGGENGDLTVHVVRGEEEGPTIYVVGGLHGDELAGWYAGVLLRSVTLKGGTLYVLAPANVYGAQEEKRRTRDDRDLNRHFPGDPEGTPAQQTAWAIYSDLMDKAPDLILDLHEANVHTDGRDNLGNSIICQDIGPIDQLIFHLLDQSQQGTLTTQPLDLFGSPPQGSLNQTATVEGGIPTITVETSRAEELPLRVQGHLRLVESVLTWYNMR